ncbi:MAG: TRAM domain-containing protein [Rhabdochlamydiaceae bacterium]|jgi:uncharacterized protein YacL
MNISLTFMRMLFVLLSIFFMTTYMISSPGGSMATNTLIGVIIGLIFGFLLIGFDIAFKRFNLRAFNIAIIGIFIGYLMGQALVLIFDAVLDISRVSIILQPQTLEIIKIALFLFGTYLGTIMTLRASDELYVSIPFVKFSPTTEKKKDLVIDSSVLADARIIDVATTGLLDHQLVIPRFVIKELYALVEIGDEFAKSKSRRCLEVIKKLEAVPELELRFNDTDFPDVKETQGKLLRLARLLDANLLTADISRVQMASIEGIRVINIHSLSNALKPLMQAGEFIKIKVQRYGKEPRQGVGYLDDGTMVVVNGGGNYIGETIDAKVLSVKHTTSGRMIFCNAIDEENLDDDEYEDDEDLDDDER